MVRNKSVFLCWSGTRSRRVAEALDTALRNLDCGLLPTRSPEIAKGTIWFEQVRNGLESAEAAIVCLTPENTENSWMHFEAGAIAAKMASKASAKAIPRVYPYLFHLSGVELPGPLAQFQATVSNKDDTLRLVRQLMVESQWQSWMPNAQKWWSALEDDLRAAEDRPLEEILPELESLFRRKTFDEPLNECVNQAWPARWTGACDTHKRLQEKVAAVSLQCRPYARDLLRQLVEAVDSYSMALGLLLSPRTFALGTDGRCEVPQGILAACERRRNEVKDLISGLADPRQAPVFEDAPRFQALGSFSAKKSLVHQFEAWLDSPADERRKSWRLAHAATDPNARTSRWDFDRIASYLCNERTPPSLKDAVDWLRVEVEKTRADVNASHMPLNYCLAPLQKAIAALPPGRDADLPIEDARELLDDVCAIGREREGKQHSAEQSRVRVEATKTLALLFEKTRPIA
jgi:hypothetical protein